MSFEHEPTSLLADGTATHAPLLKEPTGIGRGFVAADADEPTVFSGR